MGLKAGATTIALVFADGDYLSGWTESWQCNIGDMVAAENAGEALARARVGFLSARFTIEYVRVSKVQMPKVAPARNQRVSYLKPFGLGGSLQPQGDGDLPFVAALVRFYNADKTIFALRQFRGLPDNFWSQNDDKVALTTIDRPMRAYVAAVVAGGMGITHKLPAGGVALTPMVSAQYERLTHRMVGRPLYLPRGRSTR
jgi:hypothetical protein